MNILLRFLQILQFHLYWIILLIQKKLKGGILLILKLHKKFILMINWLFLWEH